MARWYAVYVQTGKEELAARHIRRDVDGVEQVVTPDAERVEVRPDGTVLRRRERLFPGYIFLRAEKMTAHLYQRLVRLRDAGVRRVFADVEVTEEEMARVAWHLTPEVTVPEEALRPEVGRKAEKARRPKPRLNPKEFRRLVRLVVERVRVRRTSLVAIIRRSIRTVIVPASDLPSVFSSPRFLEWFSVVDTT
jgi:transcription antitermination factor NusG